MKKLLIGFLLLIYPGTSFCQAHYEKQFSFTPEAGVRQWTYTEVEFGFTHAVLRGITGGEFGGGSVHLSTWAFDATAVIHNNPQFGIEAGYWRFLQYDPTIRFFSNSVGMHGFVISDLHAAAIGITLPEPAFDLHIGSLMFQVSYSYRFAVNGKAMPYFMPNEVALRIFKDCNEKAVGHLK